MQRPDRPSDIKSLSKEEAAAYWQASKEYWEQEMANTSIPEVDGMRVIMDQHGTVLFDQDGQPVSSVDERWNGNEARERRAVHDSINDELGGHFFEDDGK